LRAMIRRQGVPSLRLLAGEEIVDDAGGVADVTHQLHVDSDLSMRAQRNQRDRSGVRNVEVYVGPACRLFDSGLSARSVAKPDAIVSLTQVPREQAAKSATRRDIAFAVALGPEPLRFRPLSVGQARHQSIHGVGSDFERNAPDVNIARPEAAGRLETGN